MTTEKKPAQTTQTTQQPVSGAGQTDAGRAAKRTQLRSALEKQGLAPAQVDAALADVENIVWGTAT